MLKAGTLGRIAGFESRFDRFQPDVRDGWQEKATPGSGIWYDVGPHLLDQASVLFGIPNAILLDLGVRREGASADDDFVALLEYDGFRVSLSAGTLIAELTPRFRIHGALGSYLQLGLDPQEARLKAGETPTSHWGEAAPGTLTLHKSEGASATIQYREHPTLAGNYLAYYEGIAAALRDNVPPPVNIDDALRIMMLLEAGLDSHRQRRWIALKHHL